jgi:hypothetical protein
MRHGSSFFIAWTASTALAPWLRPTDAPGAKEAD